MQKKTIGFKYQIRNDGLYSRPFATVDWVDVFTRKELADIVIESLKYCQKEKGLKKFTYKKIIEIIKEIPESRRGWMLDRFEFAGRIDKRITNYKRCDDLLLARRHTPISKSFNILGSKATLPTKSTDALRLATKKKIINTEQVKIYYLNELNLFGGFAPEFISQNSPATCYKYESEVNQSNRLISYKILINKDCTWQEGV